MAIIVEDGSIVSGANSYSSEAQLAAYAADRGVTVSGVAAELLIRAMDYIEKQNFKGGKYTSGQNLQWPRINVVIDGFAIDNSTIPVLLIDAQIETALSIDSGSDPSAEVGRAVKRKKTGPLETEYMDSSSETVRHTAINGKLSKLTNSFGPTVSLVRV